MNYASDNQLIRKKYADMWGGHECTLDGVKARVTGRLRNFAIIGQIDGPHECEFAWETVDRIMKESNGEFRS